MSAPVKLQADQLRRLADFLEDLTKLRLEYQVIPEAYSALNVGIDGNVLEVSWDASAEAYVIDDRVGS